MDNRIIINIEEEDKLFKSIYDHQETLTELFEKQIIDEDTYNNLLDETNEALYAEKEEDYDDYEYIYRVEFVGMGKTQKLFFRDAIDTHFYLNMSYNIGRVKVRYIRVLKHSPEFQSAFYNSKNNNKIIIDNKPSKNIFFGEKELSI